MSAVMEQFALDLGNATEDLIMLEPAQCEPWPGLNPRQTFDPDEMQKLEASIAEHGVLQNIVVHDRLAEIGGSFWDRTLGPRYWIVAGESRWRCATAAGVRLPARARHFSETQALHIALLENLQRNSLLPREEGRGFAKALDLEADLTQEQLGARYGKDQSYVSARVRLLDLPDEIGALVDQKVIPPTFARDNLFRWIGEEKAPAMFTTLIGMINGRPDGTEPVQRAWFIQMVEGIASVLATKQTETEPAAAAPEPAAAAKKIEPPNKGAKKSTQKKRTPPRQVPAAEPVEDAAPSSAPEADPTEGAEPEPVPAPDASTNDVEGDVARDVVPDADAVDASEPDDVQAAIEPQAEPAHTAEDAQPRPVALAGLLGGLLPLLADHSVTVQVSLPAPGKMIAALSPKPTGGRGGPVPLVITGEPAAVEAMMLAQLPGYIDALTSAAE